MACWIPLASVLLMGWLCPKKDAIAIRPSQMAPKGLGQDYFGEEYNSDHRKKGHLKKKCDKAQKSIAYLCFLGGSSASIAINLNDPL